MQKTISAGVVGASGYTGFELIRLLRRHPRVRLAWAAARSDAGRDLRELDPSSPPLPLADQDQVNLDEVDAVFLCLPHGASQEWVHRAYQAGPLVIDLSADYRLRDPEVYARHYELSHAFPHLLEEAVYGLTELARERLPRTRLIANPGCYPTSVILGCEPLRQELQNRTVIADCKSGVSGAGRALKRSSHFIDVNENFTPYQVGNRHRHRAEMLQHLGDVGLLFTPHLLPVSRGILSTLYLPIEVPDAQRRYTEFYRDEPFVEVLPEGATATLGHAVHTNKCSLSLHPQEDHLIVVSVIDNLIKGASGQAVQNLNAHFGFPETDGLC